MSGEVPAAWEDGMSAAPVGYRPVATFDEVVRGEFIIRVYQHLLAALVAFVLFEALLINLGVAEGLYNFLVGRSSAWLLMIGGLMVVNWLATSAAHDILNPSRQYLGLFAMAAGQAVIFAPVLHYFFSVQEDGTTTVMAAALLTAVGFAGLSAVGFVTRRDLSFMRPLILWAGWSALVLIIAAVFFGLTLGIWFSLAMIVLAGAAILYQTQTILRRYPTEAYVGAALQLFGSVMLLFWYMLRLVGQLRG